MKRDDDFHENWQIFKTPLPLFHQCPKFVHPLGFGRPISNEPPPSPSDNQSIKRKHNPKMTIIYHHAQSFRSAYIFSINSLILFGLTLTSFHWADVSPSAFWWLYTLACAVVQNYQEMLFMYNYSYFWYSFWN